MTAKKAEAAAMTFNILIKKENDLFVAHCLELDIVATGQDSDQVQKEILDLIKAQVSYAFAHNNLDYLYHPAPQSVWEEFYKCKEMMESSQEIKSHFKGESTSKFVPPWMIANICKASPDHV